VSVSQRQAQNERHVNADGTHQQIDKLAPRVEIRRKVHPEGECKKLQLGTNEGPDRYRGYPEHAVSFPALPDLLSNERAHVVAADKKLALVHTLQGAMASKVVTKNSAPRPCKVKARLPVRKHAAVKRCALSARRGTPSRKSSEPGEEGDGVCRMHDFSANSPGKPCQAKLVPDLSVRRPRKDAAAFFQIHTPCDTVGHKQCGLFSEKCR